MRSFPLLISSLLSLNLIGQDLFKSIQTNDFKLVKEYSGAVNLRDTNQATPLMWAAFCSDLRMVKLLVKKGADPSLKGWILIGDSSQQIEYVYGSCLAVASGESKSRMMKYFLTKQQIPVDDREITPNGFRENGWTALHWAAVMGNMRPAKILIHKGSNLNSISENDDSKTPLIFAINNDRIQMAKLLIRRGADVNLADQKGMAPLMYALNKGNRDLIKFMIAHGAILDEYADKSLEEMLLELFGVKNINDL
jgi:ankyrin repeat protein